MKRTTGLGDENPEPAAERSPGVGVAAWTHDLGVAIDDAVTAFDDLTAKDWLRRAAHVEWNCRDVIAHLVDVALAYSLVLSARLDTTPWPTFPTTASDAPADELLVTFRASTNVLATVAANSPASARAAHPAGRSDPAGFLAMMIDEILVHTADVATGLGREFRPAEALVGRVLDRLFPWWPRRHEPWAALLWANGRRDLPGHPSPGRVWVWHCAPLEEWDGRVPTWNVTTRSLDASPPAPNAARSRRPTTSQQNNGNAGSITST